MRDYHDRIYLLTAPAGVWSSGPLVTPTLDDCDGLIKQGWDVHGPYVRETPVQRCEHGATESWWWDGFSGGWAGPLSKCECCGAEFGYIESGSVSARGESSMTLWEPKNRCSLCGGKRVHYVDGKKVEND